MQLSEKILNKIKEKNIAPKAKIIFVLKNIAFWVLFVFSVVIGSLATSIIIWVLKNNDWELQRYINENLFGFTLKTFPYLWLGVLLLFIGVAYLNYTHTKHGYRHQYYLVVLVSIVSSLILGSVFHLAGLGPRIENTLVKKVPVYNKMVEKDSMFWQKPNDGLLAGKVLIIQDEAHFVLVDLQSREWNIICEDCLKMGPPIVPGIRIKVVGNPMPEQSFMAEVIKMWRGRGCHLFDNGFSCMPPGM